MTNEDKKYLIEKVGLEQHIIGGTGDKYEYPKSGNLYKCSCGDASGWDGMYNHEKRLNTNPLDPADMVKIWVAFEAMPDELDSFVSWLWDDVGRDPLAYATIIASAPKSAAAMLEYFKEKDGIN